MNTVKDWNIGGYNLALIQDIETFSRLRDTMPGPVGMTSGGFDPIHPGHISSITHGAALMIVRSLKSSGMGRPTMVVVVNGDGFLEEKKGKAFMDLRTRCQIVAGIRGVDIVIPFEAEAGDSTVIKAIESIRPTYFLKGGDRTGIENIPEWEVCKSNGVEIITGVGESKCWSSSGFLKQWESYIQSPRRL